jgi:hypothetical protein
LSKAPWNLDVVGTIPSGLQSVPFAEQLYKLIIAIDIGFPPLSVPKWKYVEKLFVPSLSVSLVCLLAAECANLASD